jgi:hypothetical protein
MRFRFIPGMALCRLSNAKMAVRVAQERISIPLRGSNDCMEIAVRIAWIAFLGVFLFVNPVLIAWVWFMRLNEIPVSPQWRWVMSWISISLATVAFGAWIGTATNVPQKTIELTIEQLRYGVNTGLEFSFSAVVAALFANGRGRSLTAASALIPTLVYPISWVASVSLR